MAQTRGTTGNAKPRVFTTVSTEPSRKRTTKPKSKKVTTGGVTKKPATHHKRKTSAKDKVSGAAEKLAGKIEKKPGKKAAGTKKMKGTDGKSARTKKVVV